MGLIFLHKHGSGFYTAAVKLSWVIIAIREGKPMTAMVVYHVEEHDDDNISYYPIIEYTDENGDLRREKLNVSDSQKEYGERILYLYKWKFYQKKLLFPALLCWCSTFSLL